MLISETQLKSNTGVHFENYTYFGKNREDKFGGGIGILIKNELKNISAPHYSKRNIEILWLSIKRTNRKPLFIGVYYGKQESRTNKTEMEDEMDDLTEELKTIGCDGEILLAMDGNGKIGLLGEKISRNGKMLIEVFQNCEMQMINGSEKCLGKITRQDPNKPEQNSAIDFVVTSNETKDKIVKMTIDEIGLYRLTGKKESDHNTIIIEVNMDNTEMMKPEKVTTWRLNAPQEKWEEFRENLERLHNNTAVIINDPGANHSEKYDRWLGTIKKAALNSIGMTTLKDKTGPKSAELKLLREERRKVKKLFEKTEGETKVKMKEAYITKQIQVRAQIEKEQKEDIEKRLQRMCHDKSHQTFWKERKKLLHQDGTTWQITKDKNGKRLYDPEQNRENIAWYYENLYKQTERPHHPYHDQIEEKLSEYESNYEYEDDIINKCPEIEEVEKVVKNKKNGKATTDLKNELIKEGGRPMLVLIHQWVKEFWRSEDVPKQWNEGLITSLWKNKGDREDMNNQRGITVSSSISMIMEEILDNRIKETIQFTDAQGGGQKNCSTCDHVFCLRALISIAMKEGLNLFVTFFDVKKAYDHADMKDMLFILWNQGIRGKIWRLTRELNENLTAKIKTKHGITRQIKRELGGKQGGKNMTTLFSKMIDVYEEEARENEELGIIVKGRKMNSFLWVDDVATVAEGIEQQEKTLQFTNNFAVRHKLKWGIDKCNVLEIGKKKNSKAEWNLGREKIKTADEYKYLGDIINRNGNNKNNIESRMKKIKQSTAAIIACGNCEIMKQIEIQTLLKLHETVNIPALLTNSESWILNKTETANLEKTELWALKRFLNVPRTTPSPAIRFETKTLYIKIRIQIKQLIYLRKILERDPNHQSNYLLHKMDNLNIGWAKQIRNTLNEYNLTEDWDSIRLKPIKIWRNEVREAAEKINNQLLINECHKTNNGDRCEKTKTKTIVKIINCPKYNRQSYESAIMTLSKNDAKTIVMARYGMLACGKNFGNQYGGIECAHCEKTDNENHRINECIKLKEINWVDKEEKINFENVYLNDKTTLKKMATNIRKLWTLSYGKNAMNTVVQ